MDNSTLCARALLDTAIYNNDSRFFIEHFGGDIEHYTLSDYQNLLSNLTNRLRLNVLSRGLVIDDVPPVIRDLFVQGATLANVQYFYALPDATLKKYREACKPHKKSFVSKAIPRFLLDKLAQMSRKVDTLQPQELIALSDQNEISVYRLMREIIGEL